MQNKNETKEKLQTEALNKFIKYYYDEKNTRGILCACCGYGKSYLMYKIIKECVINKGENLFIIATSRIKLIEQLGINISNKEIIKKNKNKGLVYVLKIDDTNFINSGDESIEVKIGSTTDLEARIKEAQDSNAMFGQGISMLMQRMGVAD